MTDTASSPSASPNTPPEDPGIVAVQLELRRKEATAKIRGQESQIAKHEAEIAKAEQEIRDAAMPSKPITPLEGTAALEAGTAIAIESEILAHRCVETIAGTIATAMVKAYPDGEAFLVQQDTHTAALAALRVVRAQMAAISEGYAAIVAAASSPLDLQIAGREKSIGSAMGAVTSTATAVLNLVALVRSNLVIGINDVSFTSGESVLVSALARRLPPGLRIYYPRLHPILPTQNTNEFSASLMNDLDELHRARQRASDALSPVEASPPDGLRSALQELIRRHLAFEQALFTPGATGTSPIAELVHASAMDSLLRGGAKVLYLQTQKVRGSNRVKQWLWRHEVSYSGGAIVTFMVFGSDGWIELSDTIAVNSGYRTFATNSPATEANSV